MAGIEARGAHRVANVAGLAARAAPVEGVEDGGGAAARRALRRGLALRTVDKLGLTLLVERAHEVRGAVLEHVAAMAHAAVLLLRGGAEVEAHPAREDARLALVRLGGLLAVLLEPEGADALRSGPRE